MTRPAALLFLAPALLAQEGAPEVPQAPEAIRRFMMQRIQDRVGLSDAQAQKVVDRWQRYFREHTERQRQINQLRQRFQDILLGPGGEEQKSARVKPLLDQFMELRRQQAEAKFRFEDDIRADLSPAQQARLVVTVEEIINQMMKALENRPLLREMRKGALEDGGRPRRRFQ
jgi:hypothetical protein